MIIQSDQMRMGSQRYYSSSRASYNRYEQWNASGQTVFSLKNAESNHQLYRSEQQPVEEAKDSTSAPEDDNTAKTPNQDSMKNLMEKMNVSTTARRSSLRETVDNFQRLRQQTLNYLLYVLFGRKYSEKSVSAASDSNTTGNSFSDALSQATGSETSTTGAGGQYYSYFYYSEQETTCFDAKGTAVTADGREISFSISLEMSRSFTAMAEQQIDFGQPRLCDPLVINLEGPASDVTDQKFFFDIDADGTEEEISSLGSGSGYLALDKNGDGIINDGSELFGTTSGNGFQDLAAYDSDNNGWIDEADAIFSKLRIWTKDENGNDELLTLADAGVGAIYLGYENTDFSLNSPENNQTNAVIRKTGIFLYENGGSGTVQQLDLAT